MFTYTQLTFEDGGNENVPQRIVERATDMSKKDGWELVSVCPHPEIRGAFIAFFKMKAKK